ncbi:MAG: hypothetical protein R6V49_02735 [Bacteroidales bacterium]
MKRHRIVETDREIISDPEILKMKPPFADLMERLQDLPPTPAGRRLRLPRYVMIGAAALILVLVTGYFLLLRNKGHDAPVDKPLQLAEAFPPEGIEPPEPDMLEYEHFVVKPGKKAVLTTKKGSRITVPADAFAHQDGSPCTEPVDLKFIEFHTVKEIFLSGIPMQYDSAGINYTFESAGMFDIKAYSGSRSLVLADGKGINVDLVSPRSDPFNFYYFDTIQNQWEYMHTEAIASAGHGPSAPAVVPQKADKAPETPLETQGAVVVGTSSDQVLQTGQTKHAFKIEFDEKEFPELSSYKSLWFEVMDSAFAKKYLRMGTQWDSIAMKRAAEDRYVITLYRLKQSITVEAKPVDYGKPSEEALNAYQLVEAARESTRNERVQSARATRSMIEQQEQNIMQWAYSKGATIYNLGVWNWDKPVPQPMQAMSGTGSFVDKSGKPLVPKMIYLAQKEVNILWNYKPQQDWKYSNATENILWFILPDGQYAIVNDETLKRRGKTLPAEVVSKEEALNEIGRFI